MFIKYKFKVNGFSLKKGTVSVTYIPLDENIELPEYTIQQLGIDLAILSSYSSGEMTLDVFKDTIREAIIKAGSSAQYEWNSILFTEATTVPAEISEMLGVEWPEVSGLEAGENEEVNL